MNFSILLEDVTDRDLFTDMQQNKVNVIQMWRISFSYLF